MLGRVPSNLTNYPFRRFLMREIEASFPEAGRYELFTGYLSEGNLHLYRKLGYEEFREEVISPTLRLVYLGKPGTAR